MKLVETYGDASWHRLCKEMPKKTEIKCFRRYNYLKEKGLMGRDRLNSEITSEDMQLAVSRTNSMISQVAVNQSEFDPSFTPTSTQWTKEEDKILKQKV